MAIIRKTAFCEACGATVSLNDDKCSYCGSEFEPLVYDKHRLPSCKDSQFAAADAYILEPFIANFEKSYGFHPVDIDEFQDVLDVIKEHKYPFRYYLMELILLASHMRSICLERNREVRETQLEILRMLDAIHKSLTS